MILEDKNKTMSKKKGMIVSGYFNPIHKGHIEYFNKAKHLADELFVIVTNYSIVFYHPTHLLK